MLEFVFYLLAFICFASESFGISAQRVNLLALGLLFAIVPLLVSAYPA